MAEFFQKFAEYFSLPMTYRALIVGVLIALCSSLFGVTLVLKRFSFIGDGLSHVAFGSMTVAAVVGLTNQMLLALPITVLCAILLLKSGVKAKVKGDAAVAMLSVGALAIGYMLIFLFPPSSNFSADVCSTLFGSFSILTLTGADVVLCVALSVICVLTFIIFYNRIFSITFDENFARATGTNAETYNLITAVIIAVVIVLAMKLVGSLLISALIVFPALSAMRVCKTFKSVSICATLVSVACAAIGIIFAVMAGTPVGPTIVVADLIVFSACVIIGAASGRKRV